MADKFVNDKLNELANKMKVELEKVKCSVHGHSPQLEISNNEISLKNPCCKVLEDEVKKERDRLSKLGR